MPKCNQNGYIDLPSNAHNGSRTCRIDLRQTSGVMWVPTRQPILLCSTPIDHACNWPKCLSTMKSLFALRTGKWPCFMNQINSWLLHWSSYLETSLEAVVQVESPINQWLSVRIGLAHLPSQPHNNNQSSKPFFFWIKEVIR